MAINLTDEIIRIRERLARVETSLESLMDQMEALMAQMDKAPSRGAIVIPVSVVIAIAEILRTVVERTMS